MSTAVMTQPGIEAAELALINGDLAKLSPDQRLTFYNRVCDSLGLNPLTQPFAYITLNSKLTLYARKDATEQLRKRDRVSVSIVSREAVEGCYIVTARATLPDGRSDESVGAVSIEGLKGEARANAVMKAETKAKRRVTLSVCGLGMLDETEVETIPDARVHHEPEQPKQLADKPAPTPARNGNGPAGQVPFTLDDIRAKWHGSSFQSSQTFAASFARLCSMLATTAAEFDVEDLDRSVRDKVIMGENAQWSQLAADQIPAAKLAVSEYLTGLKPVAA